MSTFENNLRLEEIGTGERSGTWGTATNTNLELIGTALGYATYSLANSAAVTLTVPDAPSNTNKFRAFYLVITNGGQACTITLAPNSISKLWAIKNDTSYTLTIKQGSGATVAIIAGAMKWIATEGTGGTAKVMDVLAQATLIPHTVTATSTVQGTKLIPTADTSAGNAAAIGYTSDDGIIITGQGANNDVTIKNDADADVLKILTGQTDIVVLGTVKPLGDTSSSDAAAIGYTATEGLILTGQGSTNDVTIKNDADADVIEIPTGTTNVTMAGSVKPLTYQETLVEDATSTGSETVNLATGNVFEYILTGNVTYTFSNPPADGTAFGFTIRVKQDGSGNRTISWPGSVDWPLGVAPTLTGTANSVDVFTFFTVDGGTIYYGFTAGKKLS
jgi:hypothetical protein